MNWRNKFAIYTIILLLIPIIIFVGLTLFKDRSYIFISLTIASFGVIAIFLSYERNEENTRRMVILAVLVAISVVGRFLFAALPAFKPVTAIVVISAIFFGAESGFLVGALSALISNIYFGQGPWTPFQMFSWGMIGFIAGLPYISEKLKNNKLMLILYGIFAGIAYSLIMDVWTVMSLDNTFTIKRYITLIGLALPFTVMYAISNVVFLLLTIKPIGERLARIKLKYNI